MEKKESKGGEAPSGAHGAAGGEEKWGTNQMGAPAAPASHPQNQAAAAYWGPHRGDEERPPYVQVEPVAVEKGSWNPNQSPMENILDAFNAWAHKAESLASNVWHNLKTGASVSDAAFGKLTLTAKAITEGGFESLFRQTFPTDPSERLKKSFACYLSTTTGPVAGTLYLSTAKLAFCSDRPLYFTAPSGQQAWSYYKVSIPLAKIAAVNPVTAASPPPPNQRYIQVVTVDGHEFWFMGFVSYEKASTYLLDAVADFASKAKEAAAAGAPAEAPVGGYQ